VLRLGAVLKDVFIAACLGYHDFRAILLMAVISVIDEGVWLIVSTTCGSLFVAQASLRSPQVLSIVPDKAEAVLTLM
jgi:hypothetical protein